MLPDRVLARHLEARLRHLRGQSLARSFWLVFAGLRMVMKSLPCAVGRVRLLDHFLEPSGCESGAHIGLAHRLLRIERQQIAAAEIDAEILLAAHDEADDARRRSP